MICVNGRFLTQPLTGVQRYALEMSRELREHAGDIAFLAPRKVIHMREANCFKAEHVGSRSGYWWEQIELPRVLKSRGRPVLLNLGNVAPLLYDRSIVVIHDVSFLRFPRRYSRTFAAAYRFLIPRIARKALRVVTDSEFSKGEIVELLKIGEDRIDVIPCAVSPSIASIEQDDTTPREDFVLAVSSLDPLKNLSRLLEACQDARLKDVPLVIVGADNRVFRKSDLHSSAFADNRRIVFRGRVSDEELATLYRTASLFVFPSLYEGFGLPPLEAMACGCPTVVSTAASLPEVCGDASLYIEPMSTESIADGIFQALSDESLRSQLRSKGLARVRRYSWQASASRLLEMAKSFDSTVVDFSPNMTAASTPRMAANVK